MRWSLVDWLKRTLLPRQAYGPSPPGVSESERRAVDDALAHSTEARTRSNDTISQWERATAGAWGYRRSDG